MRLSKKVTGNAKGIPLAIALALGAAVSITVLGAAVISFLLESEKAGEGSVGYAAMITLFLSSVAGAWLAARLSKKMRLQVCLLTGGAYYLTLLAMTALLFGGQYERLGVSALITLAGCGLVAFLPSKKGSGWKRPKKTFC